MLMSNKTLAPSFLGSPAFASKHLDKTNTTHAQCHGSPLIRPPFFRLESCCSNEFDLWFQMGWTHSTEKIMGLTHLFEATPLRRSELNRQNMSPMKMWSHKTGHLAVVLIMFPPSSSKKQTVKARISCRRNAKINT